MFQLKDSQIGRILSYLGEDQSFCSVQALKELAEALPHEGGPPALVSLLIQTLISSRDTRLMFDQMSGYQIDT